MVYLSPAERHRRIVEMVKRKKGVDCPDMVVEWSGAILGGGMVKYRCTEDGSLDDLELTPQEAEYVGIDMDAYGPHP